MEHVATGGARQAGPEHMLVVDDHASFRRCASKLLISEGYDVVGEAADGASALALAARLMPDARPARHPAPGH